MAKRKYRRKGQKLSIWEELDWSMNPDTAREVAAVILLILGLIVILGMFNLAGGFGHFFMRLAVGIFGILGYYMKKSGFHPVPLVLGIILGPIAEFGLFEALSISDNGILIFVTRIPSLIIFLCIIAVIFWPYIERIYKKPKRAPIKT